MSYTFELTIEPRDGIVLALRRLTGDQLRHWLRCKVPVDARWTIRAVDAEQPSRVVAWQSRATLLRNAWPDGGEPFPGKPSSDLRPKLVSL